MGNRRVAALAALWVAACSPGSTTPTDAGPDAWAPEGVHPPRAATPRALPADVAAALDRSDDDLPILMASPTGADGYPVQIVYDDTQDDPISRWGQCLARVVACADANAGMPVTPCFALIERCDSAAGGDGCCPQRCFDDYAAARAGGMGETDAVREVFVGGDCVEGFAAQRDAAGVGVMR